MSFFEELKRRNVVRVGVAYAAIGWVLAQIAEFAFDTFGAPEWALRTFVMALFLGLPLALFFAWAFELTPEGLKREKDVDRSASITRHTGRRLDRMIIVVLGAAVVMLVAKEFYFDRGGDAGNEVTATAGRQSIAVLPFENLSGDDDNFSDGLTEEVLNVLTKNRDLKVAGRTSSFAFKGMTPSSREIGDALNVDHYLEGSVRRSGETLRITAQLIAVDDGFHVWSETYDREMAEIFEIQDEIAGAIANQLHLRLAPAADRPTDNIDAYVKYLEARAILHRQAFPTEPIEALIAEALALDPGFAKAYELRAIVLWFAGGATLDSKIAVPAINAAANTALELDDSLATARYLSEISRPGWTWSREFEAIEAALAIAPNELQLIFFHCYALRNTGYRREAMQCAQRAVEAEPLDVQAYWERSSDLIALARYDEARASLARVEELGGNARWNIGFSYLVEGRFESAIEALEQGRGTYSWEPENVRRVIESARDPASGDAFLDQWVTDHVARAANFSERILPYFWYLAFRKLDPYFDAIEAGLEDSIAGFSDFEILMNAGATNPITGYTKHPAYVRLEGRRGITDLWDTRGAPDMCSKDSGEWVCE